MAPSPLNICTQFYLRTRRNQGFLQLALGYALGIWLGREALDHLRNLAQLYSFCRISSSTWLF